MLPVERNNRTLKRRGSQDLDPGLPTKKHRLQDHPNHWLPSERFWDTLPKIYLTRRALNEHNHRHRLHESKLQPRPRQCARLQQLAHQKRFPSLCSAESKSSCPDLRRFARHGGPDLTALRGCPDPTMSDQTSRPSRRTASTRRTTSSIRSGPYDANYELKLAQAGIHVAGQKDAQGHRIKPANYDDIVTRLNEARSSLSPTRFTEQDFETFQEQTEQEILEAETMQNSMAVIEGGGSGIYSRMGGPFNNLEPFNPELAMAVPDSYDGAPPLSLDHCVLNDLGKTVVPNTDSTRPAAPNFYLEGKSRKGRADVAKRQAAYTGAIGARGMMSLQTYPNQTPQYDNKAYSFTSTYHDGTLKMYTSHATAPKMDGGPPQYHMTQLNTYGMTGNSTTFRQGATAYRNARDLAKEQRESHIQKANQAAQQTSVKKHSGRSHTSTNTLSMRTTRQSDENDDALDTDTSTDELALDKVFKRIPKRMMMKSNKRRKLTRSR